MESWKSGELERWGGIKIESWGGGGGARELERCCLTT